LELSRINQLLALFATKRILVVGDVMLDRYLWGNVNRISPEAPVPVVHVQGESCYPGGAANVARNLTPFTPSVCLIGAVGQDEHSRLLDQTLATGHIRSDALLRLADYTTIVKTRVIARQQQVVRVDRECPRPLSPEQVAPAVHFIRAEAPKLDAIILEDYGKGLLQQSLIDPVTAIAREHGIIVAADPNPNNRIHWNGVTILKPNRHEAFLMAGLPEPEPSGSPLEDEALLAVGRRLLELWTAEMILVTLSQHGMILFRRNQAPAHVPARTREVFDVSGAGDTAIALLTLTLAAGGNPLEAVQVSNFASGVVVGKLGTATLSPEELREAVQQGKTIPPALS
jgi:D-glycero-beta-D-manno-heptose-7-phosphate kinase